MATLSVKDCDKEHVELGHHFTEDLQTITHSGLSSCVLELPFPHSASWSPYLTDWSPKRTGVDSISECVFVCQFYLMIRVTTQPSLATWWLVIFPEWLHYNGTTWSHMVMMTYCQSTFEETQGQSHSWGPALHDKSVISSLQISEKEY